MPTIQAEAYNNEIFHCARCRCRYRARVATWVDVSRSPQVKALMQRWEFNTITCPRCGHRQFSGTFFFYEDFLEGMLVAVFPDVPADPGFQEEQIKQVYGYYPTLDFFYDMTQLWFLIYLQEHYKNNKPQSTASEIGRGKQQLQTFLRFVKRDPLMLTLRKTLTETVSGNKTSDDLQNIIWRALAKIEGVSPGRRGLGDAAVRMSRRPATSA